MTAYATLADIQANYGTISSSNRDRVAQLLEQAAVIIDAYNKNASEAAKRAVTIRMLVRALKSESDNGVPMGASQGSMSALGYNQSWTLGSGGSVGELYIGKIEKRILGADSRIGSRSPLEFMGASE